jgi:hypothetical protein
LVEEVIQSSSALRHSASLISGDFSGHAVLGGQFEDDVVGDAGQDAVVLRRCQEHAVP